MRQLKLATVLTMSQMRQQAAQRHALRYFFRPQVGIPAWRASQPRFEVSSIHLSPREFPWALQENGKQRATPAESRISLQRTAIVELRRIHEKRTGIFCSTGRL
jgi:hypothetical protein